MESLLERICSHQRPVRGKKKLSATICASALGMGFLRAASTSMRELKVRTLSTLGPLSVSAACEASGDSIARAMLLVSFDTVVAYLSSVYILWRCGGSCLLGKDDAAGIRSSVDASFNPASSRAPRPSVVSIAIRCVRL